MRPRYSTLQLCGDPVFPHRLDIRLRLTMFPLLYVLIGLFDIGPIEIFDRGNLRRTIVPGLFPKRRQFDGKFNPGNRVLKEFGNDPTEREPACDLETCLHFEPLRQMVDRCLRLLIYRIVKRYAIGAMGKKKGRLDEGRPVPKGRANR